MSKDSWNTKRARKRRQNLSKEENEKKQEGSRKQYKNLSEVEKWMLVENTKKIL